MARAGRPFLRPSAAMAAPDRARKEVRDSASPNRGRSDHDQSRVDRTAGCDQSESNIVPRAANR